MRKVSVLIPLHDNHFANQLCIEDALEHSGITDFEILVYNNGSTDERVAEWAKQLVLRKPGSQYFESAEVIRNSLVLNHLLSAANNEYICIMPLPSFMPKNWLFELVCANAQIINSGITAISEEDQKGVLTSKMMEDDRFKMVYQEHNNLVKGTILFHWSICLKIGGFEPLLNQGFEFAQFSYRVGKLGLSNYYLCDKNATKIGGLTPSCYFETSWEQYKDIIVKMNRSKDYSVKINEASENEMLAREHVTEVMNKFNSTFKKEFYLSLSETWGFEIIGFAQEETKYLDDFCQKHNLQWIVLPGKTEVRAISIQFYDKK